MFERPIVEEILSGLERLPALLQVLVGPRQVGKSTAAAQVAEHLGWPTHSASADSPAPLGPEWIETQWRIARSLSTSDGTVLLILDEVQKVPGWSEVVKKLWDEEKQRKGNV